LTLPAPRLFTYTILIDDGAAPNPFRGMCSLAICKTGHPHPQHSKKKSDWVRPQLLVTNSTYL
jgi:Nucleotide modification associated domain 2